MLEILKSLPNPWDVLIDPVSLIILGMYALLILWETFFPARELPKVKNWKLRGLASFAVFFYLSTYFPLVWDTYLVDYQIFDLTALGTFGGAFVAVMIWPVYMALRHA